MSKAHGSEEYAAFERLTDRLLSVPKAELDARVRAQAAWQPIEDATDQSAAPWDGQPVLIVTNHQWCSRVHRAIWTDTIHGAGIYGWAVEDCKFGPYSLRGYTQVTHWMPLPDAPTDCSLHAARPGEGE